MSGCPTFRQPLAFLRSCLEASLKCVTTAIQGMWLSADACTQPRATDSDPLGISELNRSLLIQPNLRNNKLPDRLINFSENCICKKKKSKNLNIAFVTFVRSLRNLHASKQPELESISFQRFSLQLSKIENPLQTQNCAS